MFEYLDLLRKKSHAERQRIAFVVTALCSFLLVFLWWQTFPLTRSGKLSAKEVLSPFAVVSSSAAALSRESMVKLQSVLSTSVKSSATTSGDTSQLIVTSTEGGGEEDLQILASTTATTTLPTSTSTYETEGQ
jgi:hypothetical protein